MEGLNKNQTMWLARPVALGTVLRWRLRALRTGINQLSGTRRARRRLSEG